MRLAIAPGALLLAVALAAPALAAPAPIAAPGRVAIPVGERPANTVDEGGAALGVALPGGGALLIRSPGPATLGLVRLRADGSVDRSSGGNGIAAVALPVAFSAKAVLRGPDGRLVIAGSGPAASKYQLQSLELVRLDPDGTLDASFGTGGVVDTGLQGSCGDCRPIALDPDGGIVLTGNTGSISPAVEHDPNPPASFRWVVARLRADGSSDQGFGRSGRVELPVAAGLQTGGYQADVLPGGGIVVLGHGPDRGAPLVARLTRAGDLDPRFDGGAAAAAEGLPYGFTALARTDGSVVVLGGGRLVRIDPAGHVDHAFGTVDVGGAQSPSGQLLAGPDGSTYVAAGVSHGPRLSVTAGDLIVHRTLSDGRPDPAFGVQGRLVTLGFGGGDASIFWRLTPRGIPPLGQSAFRFGGLLERADGSWLAIGGVSLVLPTGEGTGRSRGWSAVAALGPDLTPAAGFGGPQPAPRVRAAVPVQHTRYAWRVRGVLVRLATSDPGLAVVRVRARGHGLIGHATVAAFAAGSTAARIPLTRSGQRLLRSGRAARLAVSVEFRDLLTGVAQAFARGGLR